MNFVFIAALARAEDPGVCGPFEAGEHPSGLDAACSEAGVQPSADAPALDGVASLGASSAPADANAFVPGEALVAIPKGSDGLVPSDLELAPGAKLVGSFFSPVLCATIARIEGPKDVAPEALVESAPEGAAVVGHPEYTVAATEVRAFDPSAPPDPYRPYQYALTQLDAERAWNVSAGEGATIALLDSAPATAHEELTHVELVPAEGPDAGDGAATPAAALHGTLMAGVIGAQHGNGVGISGVAPGARVIAVPVCAPRGDGTADRCPLYDVLRGIDAAWEADADVLNLSLVGPSNPLLERSVARMERLGRLVVAAAGNEGTSTPRYPAAYPSVIGVGAIDADGNRYARSNTGLGVDVFAPGVEILSTRAPSGFAFGDGTSLAAAHVSGALAVLRASGVDAPTARAAIDGADGGGTETLAPLCDLLAASGSEERCLD